RHVDGDQDRHRSSHPPPTIVQCPPTCTLVIRSRAPPTRTYKSDGRPISKPCSEMMRVPSDRPCRTRYAPSGPFAEPVAGSSAMLSPYIRPCTVDPGSTVSAVKMY